MMTRDRLRNAAYRIVQVVSVAILTFHFALTFLHVTPTSPLRNSVRGLVTRTVGTWIRQDWRIFAPAPITTNDALLLRCLTAEEAAAPELPSTGWYDLATPLWEGNQRNRFTAYARLSRVPTYSGRTYLIGSLELLPWLQACQAGSAEACEVCERSLEATRAGTRPVLARIGTAACRDLDPERSTAAVALRMRRTSAIPWSQRKTSAPARWEDLPIGVFAFDPSIAAPGIYRAAVLP